MRRVAAVAIVLALGACGPGESTSTSSTGSTIATTSTSIATTSTTGVDGSGTGSTTTTAVTTTSTTATTSTTTTSTTTTTTAAPPGVTAGATLPPAVGRSEVPWDEVGEGWYVVLYDSSRADAPSAAEVRDGPVVLYLVDSAANRYEVAAWPAGDRPWSLSDATGSTALVVGTGATVDDTEWEVVDMVTGDTVVVHTAGFPEASYGSGAVVSLTRPTGANVVVYRSDGTREWLERRSREGAVLATLYEQAYVDYEGSLRWMYGHEGTSLLVTPRGGIAEVTNTGTVLRELWAPADHRCDPVRWWDAGTFLAACYGQGPGSAPVDEYGNLHTFYGRLWLLETDGSAGAPLTEYPAEPPIVVDFGYHDAWPAAADTYLQWSGDCGAAQVALLQADGTGQFVPTSPPESILVHGVAMVDIVDGEMAVYGWQGCDGSVGALFTTDLGGAHVRDLVPVLGDARGVIGVVGLATVHP